MPATIGSVLRQFGPMVYLPTILFALGEGAVLPLIPVIASKMGADLALAALVAAALVVGQLCGNIPAGWLVSRVGERITMIIAGSVAVLVSLALLIAPTLGALTAAVFFLGFCAAAFGLARHAFMTTRVPFEFRARSLSLLGGSFRLGIFVGPFIAALLLQVFGDEHATVWFLLGCLILTILLVTFGPDPEATPRTPTKGLAVPIAEDTGEAVTGSIPIHERVGVFRSMWRHRRVLSRLGVAAASMSAVRSARFVVLPLWGVSLGLDSQTIAVVVGVSGAIDFALFYASGQVMDRFGRLWAALPAMLLMGGSFLALAFTHDGDLAILWYGMFAAVLGVGNGLSSGILMTLGADTAPRIDPAPYLGSWRTLTDAGGAASPLLFAGIAAVAPLSMATGAIGLIGLFGAWAFAVWIPKYAPGR
jgi:MFS family permease